MKRLQDCAVGAQESQEDEQEESTESFSDRHNRVDVFVQLWRAWTVLAPQDISLMIRVDLTNRTVSLKLRTSGDDARFVWQDWVDAAMGFLKGFEEGQNGKFVYGRGQTCISQWWNCAHCV